MALAAARTFLALLAVLAAHAHAASGEWRSADGGSFSFGTTFEGEPIGGSFRRYELGLRFDPEAPADARLLVSIDLTSADMGDPDMNAVLSGAAWFDVPRFTTASYEASGVQPRGGAEFVADGVLKLKGVERAVSVPFTWTVEGDRARMSGTFSLRRTDFGVGSGEWATGDAIGIEVRLAFDIPLTPAE